MRCDDDEGQPRRCQLHCLGLRYVLFYFEYLSIANKCFITVRYHLYDTNTTTNTTTTTTTNTCQRQQQTTTPAKDANNVAPLPRHHHLPANTENSVLRIRVEGSPRGGQAYVGTTRTLCPALAKPGPKVVRESPLGESGNVDRFYTMSWLL